MQKTVYAFDPDTQLYRGTITLNNGDLSPLEPGVWLVPGNCLEVAPPMPLSGKLAKAQGGVWITIDAPVVETPVVTEPTTPVDTKPAATPPTPTVEKTASELLVDGVQAYMDHIAKSLGYDNLATAVTYADEPAVPKFQNEGKALRAWRSLVWAFCYELQTKVTQDLAPAPTIEQLIAMLPTLSLITPPEGTVAVPQAEAVPGGPVSASVAEPAAKPVADSVVPTTPIETKS